ncbi:MAG: type II toxin-antitoxin system HipA family toxin [Deltaproteobacteria bacterium]|nr:type II toxin-antitoxin system HipA family toxin [Deltaproteobacteria bacterium]
MTSGLTVWLEGAPVGRLFVHEGDWRFEYAVAWLDAADAYPISPRLPLRRGIFADDGRRKTVRWFFDNLLPEGSVRQALVAHVNLAQEDSFAFLEHFGHETAGALMFLPLDQPVPEMGDYEPLSLADLRALVLDLPRVPLLAGGGRARMSLAGVQHKLALHRVGDDWFLPRGAASSSIVKPENARPSLFPFCPANEHFCMTLAGRLGLVVPPCELHRLPEPLFVVERFDRRLRGGRVERVHQIDLCQLLDLWAGAKYEADGGPGLEESYQALDSTVQPAVSRHQWLRWLIFNYAIGNSDAHAKNISFLIDTRGIVLAPAYDLLSVSVYGADYDYMAMLLMGEVRYGWVEPRHWDALARTFDLSPSFLRRLRHDIARAVVPLAQDLMKSPVYTKEERAFLLGIVKVVERHVGYLLADA